MLVATYTSPYVGALLSSRPQSSITFTIVRTKPYHGKWNKNTPQVLPANDGHTRLLQYQHKAGSCVETVLHSTQTSGYPLITVAKSSALAEWLSSRHETKLTRTSKLRGINLQTMPRTAAGDWLKKRSFYVRTLHILPPNPPTHGERRCMPLPTRRLMLGPFFHHDLDHRYP